MYARFHSHNIKISLSSNYLFKYLSKENLKDKGSFFSNDFDINNPELNHYDLELCVKKIDNNLNLKHKKTSSNFYVLNVSPSQNELKHFYKMADEILNNKGLILNSFTEKEVDFINYFNEQRDKIVDLFLKDYVDDIMSIYAESLDREIYADVEKLPDENKNKELNKIIEDKFNEFLRSKDINIKDSTKNFIELKKGIVVNDYDAGKIVSFYSDDIEKKINLFVPNNSLLIEEGKIKIEEQYFINKYNNLLIEEKDKTEKIEIKEDFEDSKEDFKDYVLETKTVLKYDYSEFEKKLNLYFSPNEIEFKNGVSYVKKSIYDKKIYECKTNFLKNEFSKKREEIFNLVLKEKGHNLSTINKEKEGGLNNANAVLNQKELNKIETITSVKFNKWLVSKGYIEERKKIDITDWETKKTVEGKVLKESEKAKLIEYYDENFKNPVQFWTPNFAIKEIKEKEGKVDLLKDFYENIKEPNENDENYMFEDYTNKESLREIKVKNKESLRVQIKVEGLKEPVIFNIKKEDLQKNEEDNYFIEKEKYNIKYENHLISNAKVEFKQNLEEITKNITLENIKKSEVFRKQKIDIEFKKFLHEKNILKEKNDRFEIKAEKLNEKEFSTLISIKQDDKELNFWVNNKEISKIKEDSIEFKNKNKIIKLIDDAIKIDNERNKLVEITFDKVEKSVKVNKGEEIKEVSFYRKMQVLEKPICLKFKEEEVIEKEGKFLVEQWKKDWREENEIKKNAVKEFGYKKEELKEQVWKKNGFSPEKRKMTKEDLMYYATLENERSYKRSNKNDLKKIEFNEEIKEKIETLGKEKPLMWKKKIKSLEKDYIKDYHTKEIIFENTKKGGLNKHAHIVVSRYDKTLPKEHKISVSPMANHKAGLMPNSANVGFNRDLFFQKMESHFDNKYNYDRSVEESYKFSKLSSYSSKRIGQETASFLTKEVLYDIRNEIKNPIEQIKNEFHPLRKLKKEFEFIPISSSIPKSKLDLLLKATKMLINSAEKGMQI